MEIKICKGTWDDMDGLIALLESVRASMDHQEWFYLDSPEEIREMFRDGILHLWTAMDGERLAAALYILIPGLESYNYGYDLGFTREQLLRSVNMDTVAVHPDYRGLGLQCRLMQAAEASLLGEGERYLLCTVHPENRFSLDNARKSGYTIQKELPKYGSVRYLMRKDIL